MADGASIRAQQVIDRSFGGVSLQPPEFGGAASLRFELGGDLDPWYRLPLVPPFDLPGRLSRRERRVRQALDRAVTVFEALFADTDRGFVVAYLWPGRDTKSEAQLLDVLPPDVRVAVERDEGSNYWGDPDEAEPFTRLTAPCRPRATDYRALFRSIAQSELGLEPAFSGEVFVINESAPAIFKMYDDRGAIVYAPDASGLDALAATPWIASAQRRRA